MQRQAGCQPSYRWCHDFDPGQFIERRSPSALGGRGLFHTHAAGRPPPTPIAALLRVVFRAPSDMAVAHSRQPLCPASCNASRFGAYLHAAVRHAVRWHCHVGRTVLSQRARLVDVPFGSLVREPAAALRGVSDALGLQLSDAAIAGAVAASASPGYRNGQLLPPTPSTSTRAGGQARPFWDTLSAHGGVALARALAATLEDEAMHLEPCRPLEAAELPPQCRPFSVCPRVGAVASRS